MGAIKHLTRLSDFTVEEIMEILERAIAEIRARAGEELNEFEDYNINLLEEAEAEME